MRRSPEICGVVCGDGLEGVLIVTTGFYRGQLRGPYTGSSKDITIPITVSDSETGEAITVTSIWHDVFRNYSEDTGLNMVTFSVGDDFTRIHARAFYNNNISNITLPLSLKRIDLWAFRANNLTEIIIPEGVHTIEGRAFAENDITKITIGSSVSTIGDHAFGNTNDFREAYNAENGGAGVYNFEDGKWKKELP